LNHIIRMVSLGGTVSRIAGTGVRGGLDNPVATATFDSPVGIAVDANGTIYVSDGKGSTLRKISGGVVTTLAGSYGQPGTQDGQGAAARFGELQRIALDASGNIYAPDWWNRIHKITPTGLVSTLSAGAWTPTGVCVDSSGNLLVAQTFGQILSRIILTTMSTQTVVGAFPEMGYVNGSGTTARFSSPGQLTLNTTGQIYLSDWPGAIRTMTPSGMVGTAAGSNMTGYQDGSASTALFQEIGNVAFDPSGNAFITANWRVRKLTPSAMVTTIAGDGSIDWSPDGPALSAKFHYPRGLVVDSVGNVIVGDSWNFVLRKISPDGWASTWVGSPGASGATPGTGSSARLGISGSMAKDPAGNILFPDWWSHVIWKVTAGGAASILAGVPWEGGYVDGPIAQARFFGPEAVDVDAAGRIYVADRRNNVIRLITTDGFVTTLIGDVDAGITRPGLLRDGSDLPLFAAYASLTDTNGLTVTPDGSTLYVTSNKGVLKVSITW
jgi:sugar lactone lactonase YvrE